MTKIEWVQSPDKKQGKTWNPVTGCTKVSAGCRNCYAEGVANRFWGDRPFSAVQFHPERMEIPLKRKKPTMWFVNSMSDLFHPDVTDEQIGLILNVIKQTPHHTYQVLTKRPDRMLQHMHIGCDQGLPPVLLPNVWLGVSVEDQKAADERIPLLLQTPSAVRFLSCEPLLGYVNLSAFLPYLNWVIAGGESGSKARPCDINWIRSIVQQCQSADVPVFVKQLGTLPVTDTDTNYPVPYHRATGKGGNPDEWPEDLQVRQMPKVGVTA